MKKIIYPLLITAILSLNSFELFADPIDIDSKSSILIDGQTGQVLFEKNPDEKHFPASTTKIMTAILAIENGNMDQVMTANASAVYEIGLNGSNIGIVPGEQLRLEDLLNALLIKSANDTANIIAENIAPSKSEFIEMMNSKAAELGATNTNFTNTCGLDVQDGHPNHLTTARDLAKFARYAMTLPKFREIVTKTEYTMPDTNKHPSSFWPPSYITSTNRFLLFNKYKSPLFTYTGIKTGFTANAGYNLVSSGKNSEGMELISVLLGTEMQETNYLESKKLLEYGFNNFSLQPVNAANAVVTNVQVADSADDASSLDLVTESELKFVLPNDKNEWNLESKQHISENITAPVNKGAVLGYIEYTRNGVPLGKVNVIASASIEKKVKNEGFSFFKGSLFNKVVYGSIIFLICFMLLKTILRRVSRYVNARRRQEN